jgi:FkbM family methyltransferase
LYQKEVSAVVESHSMMLVKKTVADVQCHLDGHARGEVSTVSTLLAGQAVVSLAHIINRALRHVNLHVTRSTTHDEAMRRRYSPLAKSIALGTMLHLEADPREFDAVYDALSDEDSRKTFDWFISYRVALAFLGWDADEVVPGIMSTAEWQKVLDQLGKTFVDGAYRIDGVAVDSGFEIVAETFLLEQYRLKDIVEPGTGDVVLDCGAYMGETALWFAQRVGKSGRVVAFEPAVHSAEGLRRNLAANRSVEMAPVTVMDCAVSSSAGLLQFDTSASLQQFDIRAEDSSHADTTSTESVPAVTIDDVVEEQHLGRVDFIKMDIEGGEVDALRGAEETLKRFTPRLAISVYHRPHDLPDIVKLILEASPDYRLYLSHKLPGWTDVVLFAKRDSLP